MALTAALGYLGRADEAQQAIGEFRDKARDYVDSHPLWGQKTRDIFLTGLRKAELAD